MVTPLPVVDDAGRRVCRRCHAPVSRSAVNPRRWPHFCSSKCKETTAHEKYVARRRCKCGGVKEPGRHRCAECAVIAGRRARFRNHGTTEAAMTARLLAQDGRCAICDRSLVMADAQIDHDHGCCPDLENRGGSCGNCIRGLLCRRCNVVLGSVETNRRWWHRAVGYLETFGGEAW